MHLEVTELTTLSKTMKGHLKLSRTGLAFSRTGGAPHLLLIHTSWASGLVMEVLLAPK